MTIYNVNGNILQLCTGYTPFVENVDTQILYQHTYGNNYHICVLERDGTVSQMCGNGSAALAVHLKLENIVINDLVRVSIVQDQIRLQFLNMVIEPITTQMALIYVCGEPHLTVYKPSSSQIQQLVQEYGIDQHINVTQVYPSKKSPHYRYTTWERGVNNYTKACGTGAAAASYLLQMRRVQTPIILNKGAYIWEGSQLCMKKSSVKPVTGIDSSNRSS